MKTPLLVSILIAVTTSAAALYFYLQSAADSTRLADYESHVQQLLSQAEDNSRQRIQQEREISELRSELNTLGSQLTAVSNQLGIAEAQTDPNYERVEAEIRRQVIVEYEEANPDRLTNQRVDLIQQIAQLDPIEFSEIMGIQGQFGPFLQALVVNDERMEIIVGALSNVVTSQNLARQEIMQAAQNQEIGRREMRTQMREVMNPETMFEVLSYDLSDDELNLLTEVQEQQRTQSAVSTFSLRSGSTRAQATGSNRQGGFGVAPAQPITAPENPRN
ncbi:MAG: hypothetical protein GKR91_05730 [Pseudomonadales bacterium]|nr:hypothetical protein [Pseudomonadales bacterium]